jgi:hypothetical protein
MNGPLPSGAAARFIFQTTPDPHTGGNPDANSILNYLGRRQLIEVQSLKHGCINMRRIQSRGNFSFLNWIKTRGQAHATIPEEPIDSAEALAEPPHDAYRLLGVRSKKTGRPVHSSDPLLGAIIVLCVHGICN